jgi:hypothetical protein
MYVSAESGPAQLRYHEQSWTTTARWLLSIPASSFGHMVTALTDPCRHSLLAIEGRTSERDSEQP